MKKVECVEFIIQNEDKEMTDAFVLRLNRLIQVYCNDQIEIDQTKDFTLKLRRDLSNNTPR